MQIVLRRGAGARKDLVVPRISVYILFIEAGQKLKLCDNPSKKVRQGAAK